MKNHIYREGDRIRILRTRIISRVGYDLHPSQFIEQAEIMIALAEVQKALGLQHHHTSHRVIGKLAHALAFAMVADKGFGSNERKLHYKKITLDGDLYFDNCVSPLEGVITTVQSKYITYTGRRYPSSSHQSYDGEWDYESGGLENRKTHIILRTLYGDIETCDVEPYKE